MIGIYNTIAFDGINSGKKTETSGDKVLVVAKDNTRLTSLEIDLAATQTGTPTLDNRVAINAAYSVYIRVAKTATATGTATEASMGRYIYGGSFDCIKGILKSTYAVATLDSSMTWAISQSGGKRWFRTNSLTGVDYNNITPEKCKCNYAVWGTGGESGTFYINSNGYIYFGDNDSRFATTAEFKEWLDSHVSTSYKLQITYPLEYQEVYTVTPVSVPLTLGNNYIFATRSTATSTPVWPINKAIAVEPYITLKRPSDLEITKEDIYSGEYTTCTGEIKADHVGWKYSDITLAFDELTDDEIQVLGGMTGELIFYFDDIDGAHAEPVIKINNRHTPTRLTLPDGSIIWKNAAISVRFINAYN